MSSILNKKNLVQNALAIAMATAAVQAYAGAEPSQSEIEQLRAEVAELRAMIANQQPVIQQVIQTAPPPAPVRFDPKELKVTTQKGSEVQLYGFVRADANYIIEGVDSDFSGVGGTTGAAENKLRTTATVTRLGLDFKNNNEKHKVGGKVEVDFRGANNALRIRHAYLTYNNWLFGQTTSNFLSTTRPETIDFTTNVGNGTARHPQVRYTATLAPTTKLAVALEEGQSSGTNGTTKYSLPALTARLNQKINDKAEFSVRGIVEQYKNTDINDEALGWGVAAGGKYQILPQLKLTADVGYSHGQSGLLVASNRAYVVNGNNLEKNKQIAFEVAGTYNILPQLRSTLGYGSIVADDGSQFAKVATGQNETVRQAWINFIYSPIKPLDFGIEYIDGQRKTFAGNKFKDNRVGLMARYSF